MTIRLRLTCEVCGVGYSWVAAQYVNASNIRRWVKQEGWRTRPSDLIMSSSGKPYRVTLDYCPTCTIPKPGNRPAPAGS